MDFSTQYSQAPRRGLASLGRNRRLLKNHETLVFWMQLFADLTVVLGLLGILAYWKLGQIPVDYRFLGIITALSLTGIYSSRGVYRRAANFWRTSMRVALAWVLCLFALLILGFITKTTDIFSRQVLVIWAPAALVLQVFNHLIISTALKRHQEKSSSSLSVLVVGTGSIAKHLVSSLNQNRWLPDKVVGLVSGMDQPLREDELEALPAPLLGNLANLRQIVRERKVRRLYIALPLSESRLIEGLHIDLLDMNVDVIWAPDIFAMNLLNHSVREVAGVPLISLNESPLTSSRVSIFLKELMDKSFAALGLLVLSPLFLWIAFAVKRSSPGPVFYKQDRTGFDGKVFKVWKFRSMRMHADSAVVKQATKEDPRVTKIGKFIRKTSIDELPQLINVLQGTMSLVGPRPHAVSHNNYYSGKINAYLARHRIKPGITGLAQISGCRGETETLYKMEKRVEYDLAYINNWSLGLDIKILLKTPLSLFSKDIY